MVVEEEVEVEVEVEEEEESMNEQKNKLYVGNISFQVDEEQLNNFFEEKGIAVQSVSIIKEKYTNRSKGFGFITVGSEDEITKAIESVNGQELDGRALTVNKAREQEPRRNFSRPQREGHGPRRGGGDYGNF